MHRTDSLVQPAEELANLLTDNGTTFARALFNSGGSEAAESAIKLARQYHVENGQPERVSCLLVFGFRLAR